MDQNTTPPNLTQILSGEPSDFLVKSKSLMPLKSAMGLLFFAIFWLTIPGIGVAVLFGPVLSGGEVHFTANGSPVTAGPGNLKPLIMPGIILGLFISIGIGIFAYGLYVVFADGPWVVGTPRRLILIGPRSVRSIDWEQFNGIVEIEGNAQQANLILQMRTGRMQSRKNGPDRYVPDTTYICGIPNVYTIEQVCRQRIKEHDPTPPAQGRLV